MLPIKNKKVGYYMKIDFYDIMEHLVFPLIIVICTFVILLSIVKDYEQKQIEQINAVVNKNDLQEYENCWKLKGKYYCK